MKPNGKINNVSRNFRDHPKITQTHMYMYGKLTFLTVSADPLIKIFPTAVDPVNVTFLT